jgi:hypothetical protein
MAAEKLDFSYKPQKVHEIVSNQKQQLATDSHRLQKPGINTRLFGE